jgi:hypothetical protein
MAHAAYLVFGAKSPWSSHDHFYVIVVLIAGSTDRLIERRRAA